MCSMNLELSHLAVERDAGFLGVPVRAEVPLHRQLDVERLEQHPLSYHTVIPCHIHQNSVAIEIEGEILTHQFIDKLCSLIYIHVHTCICVSQLFVYVCH